MNPFLGKKEREALDKNLFGDPERLLFPIQSEEDVKLAAETVDLVSNASIVRENIVRIAQEKGYKLPETWTVPNFSVAPLEFALFETETKQSDLDDDLGAVVIKKGKIFEANDYPDKKYGMTPEEMLKAAKDFQPVGMNDSHNSTSLLKGKWGKLRSIKVADNGWDLEGEVAVPVWLDNALKGEPIKVSAEWNRDTKKLEKLAYVNNPRVSDAAIYAAFTQNEMATDPEMSQIMTKWFEQRLAASTQPDQPSGKTATEEPVDIKKGKTIMGYLADFKNGVLEALKRVPDEDPKQPVELNNEPKESKKEKVELSNGKKKQEEIEEPKDEKKNITIVMSEEDKQERQKLLDRIQVLEDEKLTDAAKQFAKDLIDSELAYPAEKSVIIANFIRAANDDQVNAVKIKFTVGNEEVEGTRLESLKALYAVRRPHNLTKERLVAFGAGVLNPEKNDKEDLDAARKSAEDFADQYNRRLQRQAAGNKR